MGKLKTEEKESCMFERERGRGVSVAMISHCFWSFNLQRELLAFLQQQLAVHFPCGHVGDDGAWAVEREVVKVRECGGRLWRD